MDPRRREEERWPPAAPISARHPDGTCVTAFHHQPYHATLAIGEQSVER